MLTCLYCREAKPGNEFNREHVVPRAFGMFEGNLVLHETVCAACNSYFDKHLDVQLARDSIEGFKRYELDVKMPEGGTAFGRRVCLKARINDGTFYDGAEVWWGSSTDGTRLVLYPFPQIGIANESGVQRWFAADRIPTKEELHSLGFKRGEGITIKLFGADPKVVADSLRAKGYDVAKFETLSAAAETSDVGIRITGTINRTLMRAVAKIACNYLAYHYRGVAMMDQLSEVRRFIRFDAPTERPPVSLAAADLLAGLPKDKVPVAHAVGVCWNNGRLIGQVSLFFQFHYRVLLADGGFIIPPTWVGVGHLFDPVNKQLIELTPDPRRGRPLSQG